MKIKSYLQLQKTMTIFLNWKNSNDTQTFQDNLHPASLIIAINNMLTQKGENYWSPQLSLLSTSSLSDSTVFLFLFFFLKQLSIFNLFNKQNTI